MANGNLYRTRTGPASEPANADLSFKLNEWLERSGPVQIFKTCGSCALMVKDGPAHCQMFGATPPVSVILAGCERYVDDAEPPLDAHNG